MESASCNFSWPIKCAVWPTKLQSVWPFGYSCLILTLCSLFHNPTCSATMQGCLHPHPGIFFMLTLKAFAFPFQKQEGHLFHHSEFKLNFRKMQQNFLLKRISLQIPKSVRHMFIKGTQFRELKKKVPQLLYCHKFNKSSCSCFTFFMRLT